VLSKLMEDSFSASSAIVYDLLISGIETFVSHEGILGLSKEQFNEVKRNANVNEM